MSGWAEVRGGRAEDQAGRLEPAVERDQVHAGGRTDRSRSRASATASVEVSVSDTGVGIAPEDQEAVFEEFRQVGTRREEGGRDRAGSHACAGSSSSSTAGGSGSQPARRGLDVYVHDPGAWCALIMQNPCASMPSATLNFERLLERIASADYALGDAEPLQIAGRSLHPDATPAQPARPRWVGSKVAGVSPLLWLGREPHPRGGSHLPRKGSRENFGAGGKSDFSVAAVQEGRAEHVAGSILLRLPGDPDLLTVACLSMSGGI